MLCDPCPLGGHCRSLHQPPAWAIYTFSGAIILEGPSSNDTSWGSSSRIQISVILLLLTDSWGKNYGENADLGMAKSSLSHNYLNLTFPRKRTPRVSLGLIFVSRCTWMGQGDWRMSCSLRLFGLINYVDKVLTKDVSKIQFSNCVFGNSPSPVWLLH